MELAVAVRVAAVAQAQFVHIPGCQVFLSGGAAEVVIIHKVVARVIGRVDVNHFHLAQVRALQQLEHFQVVALYVEVLRVVPIHRVLRHGAQRLVGRLGGLRLGGILAHPREPVTFAALVHHVVAQEAAQRLEVHPAGRLARLRVGRLGKDRRCHAVQRIKVKLRTIGRSGIQTVEIECVHIVCLLLLVCNYQGEVINFQHFRHKSQTCASSGFSL